MSRKAFRNSYARFRRRRRPVACGRAYTYNSEWAREYADSTIGVQYFGYEPGLLGSTSAFAVNQGNKSYSGNVAAMFDRGLLEMVASDPQKGIMVPGAYNALVPKDATTASSGGRIGTAVDNTTALYSGPQSATTYNILTSGTDISSPAHGINSNESFVFTPLNSWKYYPHSVWMRFSQRIRRQFYNPTNRVMTVYVTETRRKRSQLAAVGDGLPTNTDSDWELLDVQPWGESPRIWWSAGSDGSYVIYNDADLDTSSISQIVEAGEYYRRFLYVRFGQYEQFQIQSRGFNNTGAKTTSLLSPQFVTMSNWDPRMSYNNSTNTSDPYNPSTFGYSNPQNVRDNLANTSSVGPTLGHSNDPWHSADAGTDSKNPEVQPVGTTDPMSYKNSSDFNPLKNPFLKRLFHMRRYKYVLPPGGSAVHTFRTSGRVNPIKSRLMRNMHFYSLSASTSVVTGSRQFPYCLPFPEGYTPTPYLHAAKKTAGWSDVGAIIQVKGQMVFLKSDSATGMQYSQTRVVAHDKIQCKFRVCSYGRPVVGGARTHTTFLASSNTAADYYSVNPTAAPSAVAPSNNTT